MALCNKLFRVEEIAQSTDGTRGKIKFSHYCIREKGHEDAGKGPCESKFTKHTELSVNTSEKGR